MKKYPDIRAVIIAFGFRLSSDYCFRESGPQYTDRIAQFLFDCLGLSEDELHSELARRSSRMSFNQSVWNFARIQRVEGRKLAVVTGNADIFREVIVPSRGLDREFASIVNS